MLKYTKEHEWLAIEGDQVRVGLTHSREKFLATVTWVGRPA